MATKQPTRVTVRAFQVGFGDCLLLTFHYGAEAADARHVLIDFGSTSKPESGGFSELEIAQQIAKETGGKLHAVVATHRHRDHISGFDGESGKVIATLQPEVVLQPWTEDPEAAPDATRATGKRAPSKAAARVAAMRSFTASLDAMHAIADYARLAAANYPERSKLRQQLAFLGEENLKNLGAVKGLQDLPGKHFFLAFGEAAHLDRVLPGVKVSVLGPPTLEQSAEIEKQRSTDQDEFWHLQSKATRGAAARRALFADRYRYKGKGVPTEVRWLLPRIDELNGEQLLEIVRILDDAMNNTSLILLFEVGRKKLLFPGDAQIENWSYALKTAPRHDEICKRLAEVDLYKVGHHGSLNATPKTLWQLFEKKGGAKKPGRLIAVLSTRSGKHGHASDSTEVPRRTLVQELESHSQLVNTQRTPKGKHFVSVDIDVA